MKESIMYCHKEELTEEKQKESGYDFFYTSIEPHPRTTALYDSKAPVFKIRVREAKEGENTFYSAWWATEDTHFSMVYPTSYFSICFPYPVKLEVEAGHGQDYKVVIEEIEEYKGEE